MASNEFPFTVQFSAGSGVGKVDSAKGVLRGVTVAEVGQALGHFCYVDRLGKILGVGGADDAADFKLAAKRLPLCMDEESVLSVIAAIKTAKSSRVKTREDHDDAIGARAGFSDAFRIEEGKAVCDVTIFEGYRNRDVFLEAAAQTPELIGLSGDFKFTAEVKGDVAVMRVTRVDAVDIVDKGALTHAGLFKAGVDTAGNGKTEPLPNMSTAPTDEVPDMKAFKAMCKNMAAYRAKNAAVGAEIDECMAAFSDEPIAPVETPEITAAAKLAVKKELTTELTATFKAQISEAVTAATAEAVKAAKAEVVELKKQFSALGIKGVDAPAPVADVTAPVVTEPAKDFLSLKASVAKERNVKPSEAARLVMQEQPEAFRQYQIKLGIIKA